VSVSRDFPNFFEYPLLSEERVKLRTSNFPGLFTGTHIHSVHANKSPLEIWEKQERGRFQGVGLPKFFENPLLSQERIKLRTSTLADIVKRSIRTKAV